MISKFRITAKVAVRNPITKTIFKIRFNSMKNLYNTSHESWT